MKKIAIVIIICSLFNLLIGCSNKPTGIRDEIYNIGLDALNITDQFLDLEISADEAFIKGVDLMNKLDAASGYSKFGDLSREELLISAHIGLLSSEIYSSQRYGKGSYEEVLEARNNLAELLSEELREE